LTKSCESVASMAFHRGLTSIPHVMHTLSSGSSGSSLVDGGMCSSGARAATGDVTVVAVEERRVTLARGAGAPPALAAAVIRLALRTVPVSVRSACLNC
jgi:hypothetical protein